MCLIIAKKKGDEYDREELLKAITTASYRNSDGAGFCIKRPKNIKGKMYYNFIRKGYFDTSEDYEKDESRMMDDLDSWDIQSSDELIVHLRFTSAGPTDIDMCHPFVVSPSEDTILRSGYWVDAPMVAHNGTFHGYTSNWKGATKSDTYNFVQMFLGRGKNLEDLLAFENNQSNGVYKALMGTNKLAIIHNEADKDMTLLGNFKKEKDGNLYYSNNYYKERYDYAAYYQQEGGY